MTQTVLAPPVARIRTGGFPAARGAHANVASGMDVDVPTDPGTVRSCAVAPMLTPKDADRQAAPTTRWCSNAAPQPRTSTSQCAATAARHCAGTPMPALPPSSSACNSAAAPAAATNPTPPTDAASAAGPPSRAGGRPQHTESQTTEHEGVRVACPTTRAGRPFGPSRRTAATLGRGELLKLLLGAFYAEYNQPLVARTTAILRKWAKKEERLFERLERKYGVHPLEYWPEMAPRLAETDTNKQRLAVVLDLDETLIHSILEEDHEASQPSSAASERSTASGIDHFRIAVDGECFTVNKRPGLHDFLRRASQLYDLYVYTAGARDYAQMVVKHIDPSGSFFKGLFFRSDCVREHDDFLKDVRICDTSRGEDLRRVVLVDNNPVSFTMQPENGISIRDFYDDPSDEELPVLLHLLRAVAKFQDVRVALQKAQSNPLIAKAVAAAAQADTAQRS